MTNEIKAQIILGNTYHLYLRPGIELLEKTGGLHSFISWDKPILTDSGGYQVYSLSGRRKITEEGVNFRSHIDGSRHLFTPERAIDIQKSIGADIIMAFDECTPYPCHFNYAKNSMEMTHRWLKRCVDHFNSSPSKYSYSQSLFPIVQGSTFSDLRKQSAEKIAEFDMPGNAIGGLSVGEPAELMYKHTEEVCSILPEDKPRYLMGVGTPLDILEAVKSGIDLFDCVIPTRNARNGFLYTSKGIVKIRNSKYAFDISPIDESCECYTCSNFTKSFLHYLQKRKEMLGAQLNTIHNLFFYLGLMKKIRSSIQENSFNTLHETFKLNYSNHDKI